MSFGSTNKNGPSVGGDAYWLKVDSEGNLVPSPAGIRTVTYIETDAVCNVTSAIVTYTVPSGTLWKFQSLMLDYQASSTAGNRRILISILDAAGNILFEYLTVMNLTANLDGQYMFAAGLPESSAFSVPASGDLRYAMCPVPPEIWLEADAVVTVYDSTFVHGAGDNPDTELRVEEFILT